MTNELIANLLMVVNLIVLEGLLSVDNAAVLAIMVKDLPGDQSKKALKYGLIGAYVMRGASLFFIAWLVNLWYLKLFGGAYLLYLTYGHFSKKVDTIEEDALQGREKSKLYHLFKKMGFSTFVTTVIFVEFMDLSFSIDNIFAAVAMSDVKWVILTGVFIGILAMRFIATWFIELMKKYSSLERAAFVVIGLLGIKLVVSAIADWQHLENVIAILNNHYTDFIFSGLTVAIFCGAVIWERLKNVAIILPK